MPGPQPPTERRLPGQELGTVGPWKLTAILGRGSLGMVYVGERSGSPPHAVKVLHEVLADEAARARFLREVEVLARLDHPAIVRVVDAGQDRGRAYLVTELAAGKSLHELLAAREKLPPLEAARLAVGLAEALAHAHERGVLHRDLKPGNVIVDPITGRPRLLDFGVARCLDARALTKTGEVLGTPLYMAPEQLQGAKDLDARIDVWALGVVLYECLTGRRPFAGQDLLELTARVMTTEPVPPRLLDPGVPALLDSACRRALERERDRRYPGMPAFLADLREYVSAAGPRPEPTPAAPRRPRRSLGRKGLVVAAGALVTLAFLLPLGAVLWLARDSDPAAPGPVAAVSTPLAVEAPPPPPPPPPPPAAANWRALAEQADAEARRLAPAATVLPLVDQALAEAIRADAAPEARQELLLFRAELLHRRGRWADAIAAADGLAGTPAAREAQLIRALALLRLDREQEGLAALQALHQEDPDGVTGLTARAIFGVFTGAGGQTLEWATQALRADSEHHQARTTLGWALLNAGRASEALPVLEEQRRRAPDDPRVLYALGSARSALDDPRGALEALDQALALIEPHPFPNLLMARIRVLLALRAEARLLPDLDRYLELRPDDARTLVLRGAVRRGQGDPNGAGADWSRARQLLGPEQFAQVVQTTLGPELAAEVLRGR